MELGYIWYRFKLGVSWALTRIKINKMLLLLPVMTTLETLDRLAKSTPPSRKDLCTFIDHSPPEDAQPGQIWSIRANRQLPTDICQDGWFFICKRRQEASDGGPTFTVAPLFENVAYAHDNDAILPSRLLGFATGIAMGMSLEVDVNLLDTCVASLPDEFATPLAKFYEYVQAPAMLDCPTEVSRGLPLIEGLRARRDRFHEDLSEELEFLRPVTSFDGSVKLSQRGPRLWLRTEHPGLLPNGPVRVNLEEPLLTKFGEKWIFKLRPFGNSIECLMAPDKDPFHGDPVFTSEPRAFECLLRELNGVASLTNGRIEEGLACVTLSSGSTGWTFKSSGS